jgi:hypothetical protein
LYGACQRFFYKKDYWDVNSYYADSDKYCILTIFLFNMCSLICRSLLTFVFRLGLKVCFINGFDILMLKIKKILF